MGQSAGEGGSPRPKTVTEPLGGKGPDGRGPVRSGWSQSRMFKHAKKFVYPTNGGTPNGSFRRWATPRKKKTGLGEGKIPRGGAPGGEPKSEVSVTGDIFNEGGPSQAIGPREFGEGQKENTGGWAGNPPLLTNLRSYVSVLKDQS